MKQQNRPTEVDYGSDNKHNGEAFGGWEYEQWKVIVAFPRDKSKTEGRLG